MKKTKKQKKILKKSNEKMLFGVLGGVAEYFEFDPTVVRLVFVIIALLTGVMPAIILYIVAALIMPKKAF
jgi:phage shock protein C